MAVVHETYNLTTTPVELTVIHSNGNRSHKTIIFNTDKNSNDTTMIGDDSVTATDYGIHLDADKQFVMSGDFRADDRFYARAKTTTSVLHVLIVNG